jgi:hypothetical protein
VATRCDKVKEVEIRSVVMSVTPSVCSKLR